MQVRGIRRQRGIDVGFVVSDHADWTGLCAAVRASRAEQVFTTHGATAVFARYLREQGLDAEELRTEFGGEDDEIETISPDVEAHVRS